MFTSVSVFFLALSLRTVKSDDPVYGAVGDEVVLKPGPVQGPITSIMWKHGQDIAMEWYQGSVDGYRQFKERGSLNVTTGALTITGLTPRDSGSYTAEINNKVTSTTQLLVISRVSKPTVSTQCDADNTYCVFTCESNDTTAEPVTYSWMAEEKSWTSTKEIKITNDESEKQFHCELSNPVSTELSEPVINPFRTWKWYNTVLIICSILLIGGLLIFFIGFILYKRKKRKGKWYYRALNICSTLLILGLICFMGFIIFTLIIRKKIKDEWYYTVLLIVSILAIDGLFFFTVFILYKRKKIKEKRYYRAYIIKSLLMICLLIFVNFWIRHARKEKWYYLATIIYGSILVTIVLMIFIFYKKNKKGDWYYRALFCGSMVLICGLIIFNLYNTITGKGQSYYDLLIILSIAVIGVLFCFIFFILYIRNRIKERQLERLYQNLRVISGPNSYNQAPVPEPPEGSSTGPATNGPSETKPENIVSEVEVSMNHVPPPTASLENSEEGEALMGSSQDPESDVTSETSRKDETSLEVPPVQVHTNQTASEDTANETEEPGASNQDPTSDAAPESISEKQTRMVKPEVCLCRNREQFLGLLTMMSSLISDIGASPDQVLTDATIEAGV